MRKLSITILTFFVIIPLVFAFGTTTIKNIDQINNNTGVDIILNPVNAVKINSLNGGFALESGGAKELSESVTTSEELSRLSGVTSSVQTQLNTKVPDIRTLIMTAPLLIDGVVNRNLTVDRTISMPAATTLVDGYLTTIDWNIFNSKQDAITVLPIVNGGTGSATQNFVDLTTNQTIAGDKTVTGQFVATSTTNGNRPCPVMTEAERDAIAVPSEGDCVVNSTSTTLNFYLAGAWGEVGGGGSAGGAGEFNYLSGDDSDFEGGIGGWTGDINIALTQDLTDTLRGAAYLLTLKEGGFDASGQTRKSPVFTIDKADLEKDIAIEFDYLTGGAYVEGDVILEVIQDPNGTPITLSVSDNTLVAGQFRKLITFKADGFFREYQFVMRHAGTGTSSVGLGIDAVRIYPYFINSAIASINSTTDSNIPCPSGTTFSWGTGVDVLCSYQRVGDVARIRLEAIVTGAIGTPANSASFTLTNELPIDWDKLNPSNFAVLFNGTGLALDVGTQSVGISPQITDDAQQIAIRITNAIPRSGATVYTDPNRTGNITATSFFAFAIGDFIQIDIEVPIIGWSSGLTAVVQNKTLLKIKGAGSTTVTATANVTDISWIESEDTHSAWNSTQFTVPSTGDYLLQGYVAHIGDANIRMYINGVADKYVGLASDPSNIRKKLGGVFALTQGQVVSFRSNITTTITNTASIHWISISQLPESVVIAGTFGNCQKKFLTADITVDTVDITDLRFTGLTIGSRYRLCTLADGRFPAATDNIGLEPSNGGTKLLNIVVAASGNVINQSYICISFTATGTTVNYNAVSITAGNILRGNGLADETHGELCNDNKGVTTQW